jgi:hypothetical protein
MMSLHPTPSVTRLLLGALTAVVLLVAMSAVAASTPVTSDQFAPGWQDHARPLFNMGKAHVNDRDKWYVPANLPRGEYVLVKRTGDKAEVIDGQRFTVKGGNADIYMLLFPGYGDVEALPIADVPALRPAAPAGANALQ